MKIFIQLFNFLNRGTSHLYKVGFDYYINEKNTISIFTNQNIFDGDTFGTTAIRFVDASNNEFQNNFNENENIFVFLLTTRVGGLGLNLIKSFNILELPEHLESLDLPQNLISNDLFNQNESVALSLLVGVEVVCVKYVLAISKSPCLCY